MRDQSTRNSHPLHQVYIVTGGNSGVGKALVTLLFAKNAKVYMAARSEMKARSAIADIQKLYPQSKGRLFFLELDLADLDKVRQSAQKFLSLEDGLHVLFNNAAVMALNDKDGSAKTVQGYERHLGVNVLAHFLFTKLLSPLLVSTAKREPPNTVRVIWVSSMGLETMGEKSKGMSLDYVNYWPAMSPLERYGLSKAGNWLHAVEMARRFRTDGVISMPVNPGHLSSELNREGSMMFKTAMNIVANYPCINGAFVHLWAACSPDVTLERSGDWGKLHISLDIVLKSSHIIAQNAPWLTPKPSDTMGKILPTSGRLVDRHKVQGGRRQRPC